MIHLMLSAVLYTCLASFVIMMATLYIFVRKEHKNKELVFINICLCVIFSLSVFILIQLVAVEVSGLAGGFLHVYGLVVFALMARNELKNLSRLNTTV